ncbi:hypothetical protein D9M68_752790 [compost metagenome]
MQALEDAKELVLEPHVEPGAVVPHEHHRLAGFAGLGADLDAGLRAFAGVLQRVRDQVEQHDTQHGQIARDHRQIGDAPVDVPARGLWRELPDHLGHQGVQVHRGLAHGLAPHAREGQQIVDQRAHAAGRIGDGGHVAQALVIECRLHALLEQCQKAVDVAQRGTQVVRDGVGKRLQFLVRLFQRAGALGHALFECLVERADLLLGAVALQHRDDQ